MAVAVDGINGWVDGKMVASFGVFASWWWQGNDKGKGVKEEERNEVNEHDDIARQDCL